MTEEPENVLAVVGYLNGICEKQTEGGALKLTPFAYEDNGQSQSITFLNQPIWDSEDGDGRLEEDDVLESLESYVRRETKMLIEAIEKIKL